MNIDCEFSPFPKLKSVVAFRLPFAYTGGSSTGTCDGVTETSDHYRPLYIKFIHNYHGKHTVWLLSGSYGCSWIDSTDEETIDFILAKLKRLGHTDVVIEERLIVEDNRTIRTLDN